MQKTVLITFILIALIFSDSLSQTVVCNDTIFNNAGDLRSYMKKKKTQITTGYIFENSTFPYMHFWNYSLGMDKLIFTNCVFKGNQIFKNLELKSKLIFENCMFQNGTNSIDVNDVFDNECSTENQIFEMKNCYSDDENTISVSVIDEYNINFHTLKGSLLNDLRLEGLKTVKISKGTAKTLSIKTFDLTNVDIDSCIVEELELKGDFNSVSLVNSQIRRILCDSTVWDLLFKKFEENNLPFSESSGYVKALKAGAASVELRLKAHQLYYRLILKDKSTPLSFWFLVYMFEYSDFGTNPGKLTRAFVFASIILYTASLFYTLFFTNRNRQRRLFFIKSLCKLVTKRLKLWLGLLLFSSELMKEKELVVLSFGFLQAILWLIYLSWMVGLVLSLTSIPVLNY